MSKIVKVDVAKMEVFDYITKLKAKDGVVLGYFVTESISYYSKRYDKTIIVSKSDLSDGATSAPDIDSFGWIFHDELCATGKFSDNSKCSNWQASQVLSDILKEESQVVRSFTWKWATWLFGGGKARENGMW